jgi:exopolyphosphatase/guanosine-5'-triphosphate,3'-diphosphate pyrophosphatase
MRLGQRLSGGLSGALESSRLSREGDAIVLTLPKGAADLYGETVDRRLQKLASSLGCRAEVRVGRAAPSRSRG